LGAGFLRARLSLLLRKATFAALLASLSLVALFLPGCGQTAKPVTAPSAGQVHSYFSGPFQAVGLSQSTAAFDHAANQISISTAIGFPGLEAFIDGPFVTADSDVLATTENVAICPSVTVWSAGGVTIAGGEITVSVAALLVTLPTELLTTTVNCAPLSCAVVGGEVKLDDVAPPMSTPSFCH